MRAPCTVICTATCTPRLAEVFTADTLKKAFAVGGGERQVKQEPNASANANVKSIRSLEVEEGKGFNEMINCCFCLMIVMWVGYI